MFVISHLTNAIIEAVEKIYGVPVSPKQIQLQKTKKEFVGHITLVVFPLLKASRKSPEVTANEIGQYLVEHDAMVVGAQCVKGFLNLTIDSEVWLQLLDGIRSNESYGHSKVTAQSPLVMVEYSSPNTNKPLHLGHIRNILLGNSLSRILEAGGMRVVKTNIVNDRGIHICKSMLAWLKWGNGVTPQSSGKKGDHLVGDFYVLFDQHYKAELAELQAKGMSKEEAETNSPLMQEARELLRKWEQGDSATIALWRKMNQWVYDGFDETYRRMGVDFDKIYYESDTYLVGKEEVLRGLQEGIFTQDPDNSIWADLSMDGLDRKLLLRSDGTSVYMTQDIGTAKMRFDDYPIDKMVYVVGNEQNYHFQVLSLILDKLGFKFGKGLTHFSYGMVELPEGKMKSREGTVVDADDLIQEMIDTALSIAEEQGKGQDMTETERLEVARRVGLGSLKYFILKVDPRKNMTFNPKESIDFNGNTGSFVQYTYARIQSLLRKAQEAGLVIPKTCATLGYKPALKEEELIASLADYTDVIIEAVRSYSPAIIANYVYDLVKEYNQFYHDFSILKENNKAAQELRLALSQEVAHNIAKAMNLLGIEMPERM